LVPGFPALSRGGEPARILPRSAAARDLPERALLEEHAALGCIVLVLESAGEHLPFVARRGRFCTARFPGIKLAYCRDLATASGLPDRLAAIF
jgi:hypothetical protein